MSDDDDGTLKGFKSSALLVAAVAAILVAGWILKSAPSAAPEPTSAALTPPAPTLGSSIAPELAPPAPATVEDEGVPAPVTEPVAATAPAPPTAPAALAPVVSAPPSSDPVLTRLATRASADAARLARATGRYTAQLLVACKPNTVERLLTSGAGSTKLYVLPAQVRDDACFRVCFGSYATAKDAAAAADLPKALRGTDRIGAVEIAKVLP